MSRGYNIIVFQEISFILNAKQKKRFFLKKRKLGMEKTIFCHVYVLYMWEIDCSVVFLCGLEGWALALGCCLVCPPAVVGDG